MIRASQAARRRRVVALYTTDGKSLREIARIIGTSYETVRELLKAAGVERRPAHQVIRSKPVPSEYSKSGDAWSTPHDPSKKPRLTPAEELVLYGAGTYDDEPSPIVGRPVMIHPRASSRQPR